MRGRPPARLGRRRAARSRRRRSSRSAHQRTGSRSVGTPCCAASMTARPHPSLRDGSTCTQLLLQHLMFRPVIDVTVKGDGVGDARAARRVSTSRCSHHPPPMMSRCRSGTRGSSTATASNTSSICLCGTNRDSTATRGDVDRCAVKVSGGASSRPLRTIAMWSAFNAELDQFPCRRQRHGDVLVAPMQPRRQPRLDEPAEPARCSRPATGHCSRWQWCTSSTDAPAERQPGQERDAVLGVDHHVGPHPAQGTEPDPRADHRQPRAHVHAVPAAAAADRDTVEHLAARRTGIARGTQRDGDAAAGQLSCRSAAGRPHCRRPADGRCRASTAAGLNGYGDWTDIACQRSRRLGSSRCRAPISFAAAGHPGALGAPARRIPLRAKRPGPVLRRAGRRHRRARRRPVGVE